ncbi:UpxY family transcription antiterminator [Mucilaginibacter sp.]|jgi:transcription antitermination factor NusG|uniref:UpxY family transcription antiterminator n=1 Tax=Mucilaginibacter sp. TaxID=1882438 RepID=UPI0025FA60FB|nr:UpxY family transcription antiterminator [Mucilaginibacter sp.]
MAHFTQTEKEISDFNNSRWNVVYTKSRWEKKVDKLLKMQNINSFCPTIKTKHRWVDRIKTVELPLFKSYLFVKANPKDLLKVRQTMGVVNFVHHCGKPASINNTEIERIKTLVESYDNVEAVGLPRIRVGDTIKIQDGVLLDWQGEVLKIQGKSVVMLMKELNCALVINTDETTLSFV